MESIRKNTTILLAVLIVVKMITTSVGLAEAPDTDIEENSRPQMTGHDMRANKFIECLVFDDDLNLSIPCAEYDGNPYGFTLNHDQGIYWQLDVSSLSVGAGTGACFTVGSDLSFPIVCAEYNEIQYGFILNYAYGLYWELDVSSLTIDSVSLTKLPVDPQAVVWMQPYGNVDHGGGNSFFHDGIDFGTVDGGGFYSCAGGLVQEVILDTGLGWSGTNYRITLLIDEDLIIDYHFEIGGNAPLSERQENIFVQEGDRVVAGQHIANLIHGDDAAAADVAHVHWGIYGNAAPNECPLTLFESEVAASFEALYDSGVEKRPAYRADLCE